MLRLRLRERLSTGADDSDMVKEREIDRFTVAGTKLSLHSRRLAFEGEKGWK